MSFPHISPCGMDITFTPEDVQFTNMLPVTCKAIVGGLVFWFTDWSVSRSVTRVVGWLVGRSVVGGSVGWLGEGR